MTSAVPDAQNDLLSIPWIDMVRFVRQLSHDLRNHLNAAELQSAYIGELTTDSEIKEEIMRLRETLSGLSAVLQRLSAGFGQIKTEFMPYGGADFIEDLRKKDDGIVHALNAAHSAERSLPEWLAYTLERNPDIMKAAERRVREQAKAVEIAL